MKSIWKFPVPNKDRFTLSMPECPRSLSFQVQDGAPVLWAMIDRDDPYREFKFRLIETGTGIEISPNIYLHYIGTIQHEGYVQHLFMEIG